MKPDKETQWKIETTISVISLIISLAALLFTLAPGKIQTIKPSGFAIIRGIDWFASDHIVIPLEWENSGGRSMLIRHTKLILHKIDENGNETGEILKYYLAGEYQDISSAAFKEKYSIKSSFILEPHTMTLKTLAFHVENWWDDKGSTYTFRFTGGSKYKVYIAYEINLDPEITIYLCDINIYGSTDNLNQDRSKGFYWDFWTID